MINAFRLTMDYLNGVHVKDQTLMSLVQGIRYLKYLEIHTSRNYIASAYLIIA